MKADTFFYLLEDVFFDKLILRFRKLINVKKQTQKTKNKIQNSIKKFPGQILKKTSSRSKNRPYTYTKKKFKPVSLAVMEKIEI